MREPSKHLSKIVASVLTAVAALAVTQCGGGTTPVSPPPPPSCEDSGTCNVVPPDDLDSTTAQTLCALQAGVAQLIAATGKSSSSTVTPQDCEVSGVSQVSVTNPGSDGYFESLHLYLESSNARDVDFEVRSGDFDAGLVLFEVRPGSGGGPDQLIERALNQDQSAANEDPRLRLRLQPETGYLAVITGFGSGDTGGYTLTATPVQTSNPPPPPPAPGTIRTSVTVQGSGGPFTALVGGNKSKTVSGNGSIDFPGLGPGPYSVELRDLGGCTVSTQNPTSATVVSNQTVTVGFDVTCGSVRGTGDLRVRANTTGSSLDPDGYTVSLDNGAQTAALAINGTMTFAGILDGSHTVALQGVASTCSISNGSATRSVTVPTGGQVTETFDVSCAAPATPDLVVSSLTHAPSGPTTADAVTVTAVVENVGTLQAPASEVEIDLDGEANPPRFAVPALGPGQSMQIVRQVGQLAAGSHATKATADIADVVAEADEGNNVAGDAFNVAVPATPDLVVSTLTHSPSSPSTADAVTVTAVVENIGTAQAPASTLSIDLNGESSPPTFAVPALNPGQTQQVVRQVGQLAAGAYQVTAEADVANQVNESDENDNTAVDNFNVVAAVPPVLSSPQSTLVQLNDPNCSNNGSLFLVTIKYADGDGDVLPSVTTLTDNFTFTPSGTSGSFTITPNVTGDGFNGTVSFQACTFYNQDQSITDSIVITDAAQNQSNAVQVTRQRPPGANSVGTGPGQQRPIGG